jgi:tight adherence protein C
MAMLHIAGLELSNFALAAIAMTGFAVVLLVWLATGSPDASARRVRQLEYRRTALSSGSPDPVRAARPQTENLMRRIVTSLNLLRTDRAEQMSLRLASAGWRRSDAVVKYLFAKLVMPAALGLGSFFYMSLLNLLSSGGGLLRSLTAVGFTILGFFGPDLWVKNAIKKRQTKIQRQLPDILDMMVTCTEAGLSLDTTLKRAAAEFITSAPELADELALTSVELEFLPDRNQALVNLADRVALPSVRALVNTLQQSQRFGTPLSEAMRVLAQEFRDERILRAEEKAARLPAMMTVPMVCFILPPLFVVLLGPALLRIFDNLGGK